VKRRHLFLPAIPAVSGSRSVGHAECQRLVLRFSSVSGFGSWINIEFT